MARIPTSLDKKAKKIMESGKKLNPFQKKMREALRKERGE